MLLGITKSLDPSRCVNVVGYVLRSFGSKTSFGNVNAPSQKLQKNPSRTARLKSNPALTLCSPPKPIWCHEKLSTSWKRHSVVSYEFAEDLPWLELAKLNCGTSGVFGMEPPGRRAYWTRNSLRLVGPSTLVSAE